MDVQTSRRKDVFTIVERDGRSFWCKIGAAFTNRDGSLQLRLDALPMNGKLQVRDPPPVQENGWDRDRRFENRPGELPGDDPLRPRLPAREPIPQLDPIP